VQGGRVRYIDDDVAGSRDAIGIEDAFVGRLGEYAGVPAGVWDGHVVRFVRELALRFARTTGGGSGGPGGCAPPPGCGRRARRTSSVCSARSRRYHHETCGS
jgi:hypothetical protein